MDIGKGKKVCGEILRRGGGMVVGGNGIQYSEKD
jgi:hypothetical protein